MWNAGQTGVKNNGEDIYDTASCPFPKGCFPHENPPEHHFLHLIVAWSSTVRPSEYAQGCLLCAWLSHKLLFCSLCYVSIPAASCHLVLQPACLCLMASLHLSTALKLFLLAAAQEKSEACQGGLQMLTCSSLPRSACDQCLLEVK